MLQAGIAVKVTIVHSFSLIYAANMSACASAGFRDTTATMLRSYAIDQTKQDNPALGRPPPRTPDLRLQERAQEWFSGTKMRAKNGPVF